MAESLVEVPDAIHTALDPGPPGTPAAVARSLARAVAPPESPRPAPPWLRPDQVGAFRRVVAALDRYGAALLADPVGSGKTWIALAVARALGGRQVALVPAALATQWRRTADRLGVNLAIHTHETLSRGRAPSARATLAIVDESHRFRNPGTRRYRTLAPWLVRRRLLLLSATPVVNHAADLLHQLRLGLRPDALALRGIPDLGRHLIEVGAHPALGDLVHCRAAPTGMPLRALGRMAIPPGPAERRALADIDALRLSRAPGIAALIRVTLWRALASSRAAAAGALHRYLALLEHARRAGAAGRSVNRAALRRLVGEAPDQLLLWELLPDPGGTVELAPEDRPVVSALLPVLESPSTDPRAAALARLLGDGRPTLVFTAHRDTLHYLRRSLAPLRPAWVSGYAAGIGTERGQRQAILDLFRPGPEPTGPLVPPRRPTVLLATDVAAEGLDLQRADRIVHYDLPWTAVRLDQREGRAARLGGRAEVIEIVRFEPWPSLDARLRQGERLAAKRRLVSTAGLDPAGRWRFRWRADLAAWAGPADGPAAGFAVAQGDEPGWLLGIALDRVTGEGRSRREPAALVWLPDDGAATEDPERVTARLAAALAASEYRHPTPADLASLRRAVAPLLRERLRAALGRAWSAAEVAPAERALARRARRLAAGEARARNPVRLGQAERLLAWLAGGLTAGEASLAARLAGSGDRDLLAGWAALGFAPAPRPTPAIRLAGAIRFDTFRGLAVRHSG